MIDHFYCILYKFSISVFDCGNSEKNVHELCDEIYNFHTRVCIQNLSFWFKEPMQQETTMLCLE
jgi:hypothetical protein